MTDQLPATVLPGTLALKADIRLVPGLIADAGEAAGWRYVEFFTANIRNPHTRRAYARACAAFFAWCAVRGLALPNHPAVRRGGLGRGFAGASLGARREPAGRCINQDFRTAMRPLSEPS